MTKKLYWILILCLFAGHAWGALSASTIFEVNQAGSSNTNGACFVEGSSGTDNTYPTPTVTTYTDLVAVTATTITSVAFPFDANSPGRCLRITSGTGWTTGLYYIVSQLAGTATVDRAIAVMGSTGGNGKSGGALATVGQLNTDMCSGCRAYVKADATYVIAAKISFNYSNALPTFIEGYTTMRGDNGKPTVQTSASLGDRMFDMGVTGGKFTFRNFIIDINNQASTTGLLSFGPQTEENLEIINFVTATFGALAFFGQGGICSNCYIHDGTTTGSVVIFVDSGNICTSCTIRNVAGNGAVAFEMRRSLCSYCVVDTMTGTNADGFQAENVGSAWTIDHCAVYNVTRDNIRITNVAFPGQVTNCVFSGGVNGINNTSGTTLRVGDFYNDYNFTFGVSGSAVLGLTAGTHSVTLGADPFTDASTHTFTLNNAAGGGAAVTNAGSPSSLPGVTGTGFPAGGVLQPTVAASVAGGGSVVIP